MTYPVEIGCHGFDAQSTSFSSGEVRKAVRGRAEDAEKGRFWLWLRRNDKSWGAEKPQGIRI